MGEIFAVEWLLLKRLILYLLALLFAVVVAVVLEIPPNNGAKAHLRLLAWVPIIIWSGLFFGGLCKAWDLSYFWQDIIVTVVVVLSIVLSVLFLAPMLKVFKKM